jgi:hypothetical protein
MGSVPVVCHLQRRKPGRPTTFLRHVRKSAVTPLNGDQRRVVAAWERNNFRIVAAGRRECNTLQVAILLTRARVEVVVVVVGVFTITAFKVVGQPFPEVEGAKDGQYDDGDEQSP